MRLNRPQAPIRLIRLRVDGMTPTLGLIESKVIQTSWKLLSLKEMGFVEGGPSPELFRSVIRVSEGRWIVALTSDKLQFAM